jgi:hypothetical protein
MSQGSLEHGVYRKLTLTNCISRVLSKHNMETVCLLSRKLSSFLRPIKDDLALKMPGVYSIPCEHGKVYIGQTGCLIETRVKEHHRHLCLYYPEKSVVAEHSINLGHWIQLQNTSIWAKKLRWMDQIIREAIVIKLHPDNVNKEDGFSLSQARKPLIPDLKERRQSLTKESTLSSGPEKGLYLPSICRPLL